ncbi:MAG: LamG domain-containing protein [Candidatus Micrarchaeota archaeon]|nr:LamG domain-containing protein [Candidatus Micrarchaeota archaeon]
MVKKNSRIGKRRGVFLTVDMAVSLMLMFTVITVAAYYFIQPSSNAFSNQVVRDYMRDTVSVISASGGFGAPLQSTETPDTTNMRSILRANPLSVCLEISTYGTVISDQMRGYWKLDNAGVAVPDYSGNALTGVVIGAQQTDENGKTGLSYAFEGETSMINISGSDELNPYNDSFSISTWIKTYTGGGIGFGSRGMIFAKPLNPDAGYALEADASTGFVYACYYTAIGGGDCNDGGAEVVSKDLRDSGWNHIVAVFNRYDGTVKMYVNAQEQVAVNSNFAGVAPLASESPASIGGIYDGVIKNGFSGSIDEVRFYKKALSQNEINELYANSANLLYNVNEADCPYGGGDIQSMTVPFTYADSSGATQNGVAVVKGWLKKTN